MISIFQPTTNSGKEWDGFQPTAYRLHFRKVEDLPLSRRSKRQETSTPTTAGEVLRELLPWWDSGDHDVMPLENLTFERDPFGGGVTIDTGDGKEFNLEGPSFSEDVVIALLELAKEGINGLACQW